MMYEKETRYNKGNVIEDAELAREPEEKAIEILSLAFDKASFENLHDKPEFWHRGDVKMTFNGHEAYGDIKDESCVHYTKNIFCENYKYFHKTPNKKSNGWMRASRYDLVFIFDDIDKNIYVLDFRKLKKVYEDYPLKRSKLSDCNAYGNCVPLSECRKSGIMRFHIKWKENQDGSYEVVDIKRYSGEKAA